MRTLTAMKADIEALKSTFGRSMKVGPIAVVDGTRGYRVALGESSDGEPFLSPFYPHPEGAGVNASWVPLSVGQVVGVINPGGDPRQGVLIRGGFGGDNAPISEDPAAVMFTFGGVTVSIVGGAAVITSDGPVTVNAPQVNLGGEGGLDVARVGDMVEITAGSSAGKWPIVTGSAVVKSA